MGGHGKGSGGGANALVGSIRNSSATQKGIALAITTSKYGRETIAPGDNGNFRLISKRGTAKLSRKEAVEYVKMTQKTGGNVKQV